MHVYWGSCTSRHAQSRKNLRYRSPLIPRHMSRQRWAIINAAWCNPERLVNALHIHTHLDWLWKNLFESDFCVWAAFHTSLHDSTMDLFSLQNFTCESCDCTLKGKFTQKQKCCHPLLTLMLFQTRKTFVRLQNTNRGLLEINIWRFIFS